MVLEHYETELELAQYVSKLEAQVKAYKALCERLQAQADEMRSGSQWISVEDRMPTVAERVLVFTGEVEEAIYWAERDRDGEVVRDGFCDVFENDIEVTHWMPLPASPTTSGDSHD